MVQNGVDRNLHLYVGGYSMEIGKFIGNFRLVGAIQFCTRNTTKVALAINIDYALRRPFHYEL